MIKQNKQNTDQINQYSIFEILFPILHFSYRIWRRLNHQFVLKARILLGGEGGDRPQTCARLWNVTKVVQSVWIAPMLIVMSCIARIASYTTIP